MLIDWVMEIDPPKYPWRITELGCGAGDISGPYAKDHIVNGYDIVPAAQAECEKRWPEMIFHLEDVGTVAPFESEILVMCEFLEHVVNPIAIAHQWMWKSKTAIIGHPLHEPDPPFEPGHIWSYNKADWRGWALNNGHQIIQEITFPMGPYDEMIIGLTKRLM